MAGALARGWNEPVVVADIDARQGGRARRVRRRHRRGVERRARRAGGCRDPLPQAAAARGGRRRGPRRCGRDRVDPRAAVPVAAVEAAYPDKPVYRFMPNQAAEVRRGVSCYVAGSRAADGPEDEILELFGRIGTVVPMPDDQMDTATAVMSCAPAWIALVAEALVDAGVRHGLDRDAGGPAGRRGGGGHRRAARGRGRRAGGAAAPRHLARRPHRARDRSTRGGRRTRRFRLGRGRGGEPMTTAPARDHPR